MYGVRPTSKLVIAQSPLFHSYLHLQIHTDPEGISLPTCYRIPLRQEIKADPTGGVDLLVKIEKE